MKITVLCVGKIKEKYFTGAIEEYSKRLSRYCKLEIIEVADEKTPDGKFVAIITSSSCFANDIMLDFGVEP